MQVESKLAQTSGQSSARLLPERELIDPESAPIDGRSIRLSDRQSQKAAGDDANPDPRSLNGRFDVSLRGVLHSLCRDAGEESQSQQRKTGRLERISHGSPNLGP